MMKTIKKTASIILATSIMASCVPLIASAAVSVDLKYNLETSRPAYNGKDDLQTTSDGQLVWGGSSNNYRLYGYSAGAARLTAGNGYKDFYNAKETAATWYFEKGSLGKPDSNRALVNKLDSTVGAASYGGFNAYTESLAFYSNGEAFNAAEAGEGKSVRASISFAKENIDFAKILVRAGLNIGGNYQANINILEVMDENTIEIFDTAVKSNYKVTDSEWHKFDLILTPEVVNGKTTLKYDAYINNIPIVTEGVYAPSFAGDVNRVKGPYNMRIYGFEPKSSQETTYKSVTENGTTRYYAKESGTFYTDDFGIAVADNREDLLPASPVTISSDNANYSKYISNPNSLILYAPYGATVADYKGNVAVSGADSFDFYKNGVLLEDTEVIEGADVEFVTATGKIYGKVFVSENLYCEYFSNTEYSESTPENTMPTGFGRTTNGGDAYKIRYVEGVGDLSDNDVSMQIKADGAVIDDGLFVNFGIDSASVAGKATYNPITMETSFYAEEGAELYKVWSAFMVNGSRKAFPFITLKSNGKVYWSENAEIDGVYWRTNEWNRLAITYYPIGYMDVYLNGAKIATNKTDAFDNVGYIRFETNYVDITNPGGTLYLDNIDVYSGGYQAIQDKDVTVTNNDTENMTIFPATSELFINSESDFFDLSEVVEKLSVNGLQTWKLFGDKTYTQEISDFVEISIDDADGKVLVLTSEDGTNKKYLTLRVSDGGVEVNRPEASASLEDKMVYVKGNLQPLFGAEEKLWIIIAEYDATTKALTGVAKKEVTLNGKRVAEAIDVSEFIDASSNMRVYLWEADSLKPFAEALPVTVK